MDDPSPDPYRAPEALLAAETAPPTDEELLAFAGPNGAYYLGSWLAHRDGKSGWPSPNFAALLFSPAWTFYRRMFWQGIAVTVATDAAVQLAGIGLQLAVREPSADLQRLVQLVTLLLCAGVWSQLANHIYYQRALRAIRHARQTEPSPETRLSYLQQAGGTRAGLVVLGVALNLVVLIVFEAALELVLEKVQQP